LRAQIGSYGCVKALDGGPSAIYGRARTRTRSVHTAPFFVTGAVELGVTYLVRRKHDSGAVELGAPIGSYGAAD
jgi:hypothetical protein